MDKTDSYRIPRFRQRFEMEVKRSRFITTIDFVQNREQSKVLLETLKNEFPDANHHCWAVILGSPTDSHGQDQSDDGEPKGTAGKPMLHVLQHSGLGHVMSVVTRYFGGIKLGSGGLVRAYSSAVSTALKELDTVEYLLKKQIDIVLPYSILDTFKHRIAETRSEIVQEIFTDDVRLSIEIPESDLDSIITLIHNIGQGNISIQDND